MAVRFFTVSPKSLLDEFNKRLSQSEEKGRINTWKRSNDKIYYTHSSQQWGSLAWFKPEIYEDRLTFNIIKPKNRNITTTVYGFYHGHLIETFLNHFDNLFTIGAGTAKPTDKDLISNN
ncbi:hypothetical protein [Novacetimonas cocois]|uniref:Uncharacterized protein n=1 Tax=Novacetimonas cocois TaxID=1747507 RepID=A0A365YXI3_9PROT|nr:hypothetical protein [Novacetimonas cocois]RBM07999.1 hypothetical protein NJLHNGOC_05975 [Novacetimonas cocois]